MDKDRQGLMQERLQQSLDDIDRVYGLDPKNWKKSWKVYPKRRCSATRWGFGFRMMELKADLVNGKKTCPVEGRTVEVVTPHPAVNIVGPLAAKQCDRCPLCGLKPDSYDFS